MHSVVDLLITHIWWDYAEADSFGRVYHGFNLVEGAAWFVVAALVLRRWARERQSPLEFAYAAAFITFALSDFREAYRLESWLIVAKGLNLIALIALRHYLLKRYYPTSKSY